MDTNKLPEQMPDPKRRKRKQLLRILLVCMIVYAAILLVLSSGRFTGTQVWFGVQSLNTLGFFIAVAAFVKSCQRD